MIQSLNTATANTKKPLPRIHLINPILTLNLLINLKRTTNLMADTDSLMVDTDSLMVDTDSLMVDTDRLLVDTDTLNASDTDISSLTVDTTDPMVDVPTTHPVVPTEKEVTQDTLKKNLQLLLRRKRNLPALKARQIS